MADIFGVRVTTELNITDSLIVICNDPIGQTEPAVTFAGSNYFVAWLDQAFDERTTYIKVARVDPQGVVLDAGVSMGIGDCHPDIAFDGNCCMVVWSEDFYGVKGRLINAACQPEGQIIAVAPTLGTSTSPAIEYGNTYYLVAWPDFCPAGDLDIYGQLVSPNGQLVGEQIHIADGLQIQNYPAIDFDGTAFLVVWIEDANSVCGRYVSNDGLPLGTKFPISDNTPYERQSPSLKVGTNNVLFVWNEFHEDFDVYGNMDVVTGVAEATTAVQTCGIMVLGSQLRKYLAGDHKLYDVQGRQVSRGPIAPGVYFLEGGQKDLTKIVVIR
jgi:hypothetical protein